MQISITYDSSVANAPAGFKTAVEAAVQYFEDTFSDPIKVNISVGWGEVGGTPLDSNAAGRSEANSGNYTYAQVLAALTATAATPDDFAAVASLAATDPTGGAMFYVTTAEAKALGVFSGAPSVLDGAIGLSSTAAFTFDPNNRAVAGEIDAIGVIEHEISEVLGRIAFGGQPAQAGGDPYAPLDLFRYVSAGQRALNPETAAWFSPDGAHRGGRVCERPGELCSGRWSRARVGLQGPCRYRASTYS